MQGIYLAGMSRPKPLHVRLLIEKLAEESGLPLDYYGFGRMSELISEDLSDRISQRYLDDIYRHAGKQVKQGKTETRIRVDRLDIIANYLGFKNILQFIARCEAKVPKELEALCSNWWSYVRSNSGKYILKAPVRIFRDMQSGKIMMSLCGQTHRFSGELTHRGTCVFGYLDSGEDKRIALVFKTGTGNVNVLQGTFCGISSSYDPIAGREVLVRAEEEFQQMSWQKLHVDDNSIPREIRQYFSMHDKNCLKINEVSDFELADLV